jgi:DNA-binding transcriptional ArsR family regulator
MVKHQSASLDQIFGALSDATRREMLRGLSSGERSVSELAEPFAMSLAAASKHVKVLENAGLIEREVCGRTHLCRLNPKPLVSAHEWLAFYEDFWTSRLTALDQLLRDEASQPTAIASPSKKGKKNERSRKP